jgi:uncharacterized protein YhbP (UPF0306 family)
MPADTPRDVIRSFLAGQSTLSLATLGPDGHPQAASLFFVADDQLCLYWTSGPHSRHSLNLAHDARAAVTVHASVWSWTEIRGVQMEGQVERLPAGEAWQAAWQRYLAKFPFVREFQAEVSRSNFYRFTPEWVRLVDNSQGFGHKDEFRLETPPE